MAKVSFNRSSEGIGAMYKLTLLLVLFGFLVASDAIVVDQVSYIDDIQLSYENGIWQCDMIKCPLGIYGCRIIRKNISEYPPRLKRTNVCFHANGAEVINASITEDIPQRRLVDVNVESYVDVVPDWTVDYSKDPIFGTKMLVVNGLFGHGDKWEEVQERTRALIKEVEEKANGNGQEALLKSMSHKGEIKN